MQAAKVLTSGKSLCHWHPPPQRHFNANHERSFEAVLEQLQLLCRLLVGSQTGINDYCV
jgi:hypothetical protein